MPVRRLPERKGIPAILSLAQQKAEDARQERIGERNLRRSRISGSVAIKRAENEQKRAEKTAKREKVQAATLQGGLAVAGAVAGGVIGAGAAAPTLSAGASASGVPGIAFAAEQAAVTAAAPSFSLVGAQVGASLGQTLGAAATGGQVPDVSRSIQELIRSLEKGRSSNPSGGNTPFTRVGQALNNIERLMQGDLDADLATVAPGPNPSAPFVPPRQGAGTLSLP